MVNPIPSYTLAKPEKIIFFFVICFCILGVLRAQASERAEEYKNIGNEYYVKHQYDRAIHYFTKAIEDNPDFTPAYYNRGLVFYDLDLFYKAIVDFDMVLMMNPNDKDAYFFRGLSYSKVDKLKLALADVKKAASLGHNDAQSLVKSGKLMHEIQRSRSKHNKIATILDKNSSEQTKKNKILDVDNEFGGSTIQTTYSKGDPLFDGSEGIFRQIDFYDKKDRLVMSEHYHTATFNKINNRNKTIIWYNDNLRIVKKEFSYTGKLLNFKGVYEYDDEGILIKRILIDKFGKEVSSQRSP